MNEKRAAFLLIVSVHLSFALSCSHVRSQEKRHPSETEAPVQFLPGENTGRFGPYLGEEPPGLVPKLFAPGIISTSGHYEMDLSFTRDGKECYVGRDGQWLVSRLTEDGWTAPENAPFRFEQFGPMALTTVDEQRMILSGPGGLAVSYRTANGWTEPEVFMRGMGKSITNDGTVYTSWIHEPSGEWRLYRSQYREGRYSDPEEIALSIYSEPNEVLKGMAATHPQVAPDESYIIFESRQPDGFGETDYYISFRNKDGTWGVPANLGEEVNCSIQNARARISHDGKYFFFNRFGDMYWVSTEYLYQFKPDSRDQ